MWASLEESKFFIKVAQQAIDSQHAFYKMNFSNTLLQFSEEDMKNMRRDAAVCQSKTTFNHNKLQAVACIASSAMVSIALMYWAVRSFF